MVSQDFQEKRDIGLQYEKALERWMQIERGFYTLPTYDYNGVKEDKAPRLMSKTNHLVIPDLLAFGDAGARWCEVKFKTHADWNYKYQRLVTGIPLHHWKHYQTVRRVTGIPVFLCFIHDKENQVFVDSIEALTNKISHQYDGGKMGRSGMIFFCFDKLNPLIPKSALDVYTEKDAS